MERHLPYPVDGAATLIESPLHGAKCARRMAARRARAGPRSRSCEAAIESIIIYDAANSPPEPAAGLLDIETPVAPLISALVQEPLLT